MKGTLTTVEEVVLPARTVVGTRERVASADLAAFFGRAMPAVMTELAELGAVPAGPPIAVYRRADGQTFEVTVGFPLVGPPPAWHTLVVEHLPAGPAVQAEHVGPYETLPATYAALSDWFSAHRRSLPDTMWEEYLSGPGSTDEAGYRTRVGYPLR
jgi:effector-binding domain-containing protein